jgi:hypothetical protein
MMLLSAPDEMPVILSISARMVVRRNHSSIACFLVCSLSSYLALINSYRRFIVKLTIKVIYIEIIGKYFLIVWPDSVV